MFENTSHLWVIHMSNHARIAERAQEEGFVCIGWTKMGNLSPLNTRQLVKDAMRRAYPEWGTGTINACFGQVFRFAHEMAKGDPVVYPIKGSRDILIGEVAGPYRWAADDALLFENDYCNVRPVRWLKRVPRIAFSEAALHSFGSFSSVSTSDEFLDEVIAVLESDSDFSTRRATEAEDAAPRVHTAGEPAVGQLQADTTVGVAAEVSNLADRAIEETKDYLLRQWSRTGVEFEEVVAAVFRAMGYTATTQQGTHDLGVDVIAHPDPLGVQPPLLKIQCKSGTGTVGGPAVNQLRGLLNDTEKGVIVALGRFSTDARHVEQNDADLVLIDGDRFVDLFLAHYEQLSPEWRHRFPLTRVYVATG